MVVEEDEEEEVVEAEEVISQFNISTFLSPFCATEFVLLDLFGVWFIEKKKMYC